LNPPPPESRSGGQPATIAHIEGYRSRQDG
jgi:hypothetical protein